MKSEKEMQSAVQQVSMSKIIGTFALYISHWLYK